MEHGTVAGNERIGAGIFGDNHGIDGKPQVVRPAIRSDGIPVFTCNPGMVPPSDDTPENGGSHTRGN